MDIELELLISIHLIRHEVKRVSFELSGQKVRVVMANSTRHIVDGRAEPRQAVAAPADARAQAAANNIGTLAPWQRSSAQYLGHSKVI